ncbi:S-layer homology domain-containing protein, partial [Intestinimonas massiliensis]
LVLLLFLNPAVAAEPPAARMDRAVQLWGSAGAVPFAAGGAISDVARNDDGATAAAWCREAGLLLGTGDGRFSPDRPLTREELAVALRRYARILGR